MRGGQNFANYPRARRFDRLFSTTGLVLWAGSNWEPGIRERRMDELRLNKLFAAFLFAALLLMAGIKISDFMVPRQALKFIRN